MTYNEHRINIDTALLEVPYIPHIYALTWDFRKDKL